MKDNDFRQLVDREFAPLVWTDAQRLAALDRMNKEEAPVKKKLTFGLIAVIALMVVTLTSFAVGLSGYTLSDFFEDLNKERERFYSFTDEDRMYVAEDAVAVPEEQRHTSALVDVSVQQAYLTGEALYLTIHVTPRADSAVLVSRASAPIYYNGKETRYFDLYKQEELTLLDVGGFAIDYDVYGTPVALTEDYVERHQSPDDRGVTYLVVLTCKEGVSHLTSRNAPPLVLRFCVDDCRTRKLEWNTLILDLPVMEVADGTDYMLQY